MASKSGQSPSPRGWLQSLLGARTDLCRQPQDGQRNPVTTIEIFFDLVFVFAVTQISQSLYADISVIGALRVLILLVAVWWVWMYTTWVTNLLDPERGPVQLLILTMMGIGLALSSVLPAAFGQRGLAFAVIYVLLQVGRTLFVLWAVRRHDQSIYANYQRILVRLLTSGAFWLAGGLSEGDARLGLWLIAVLLDISSPASGFWFPRLGQTSADEWNVDGGHMSERAGLFVIIALGESIVLTGGTFAVTEQTLVVSIAFASAFVSTAAMWWIYFKTGSGWASESIQRSDAPGRIARWAYTYLHLPIVAGVIVTAVADELVLANPGQTASASLIVVSIAGPALFLAGTLGFKWAATQRFARSHVVGLVLLAILVPLSPFLPALSLSILTTLILILTGAGEFLVIRRTDDEELLA